MMKERLPIWFQALAMALLSSAYVGALWWVWRQHHGALDYRVQYGIEDATHNILYLYLPISILFLGGRFFWRFVCVEGRRRWDEILLCWLAAVVVLPALIAFAFWFLPGTQRVREASFAATEFSGLPADENGKTAV
jgi:hypothetical protein